MKFREFVGENEVKKIIKSTEIKPTIKKTYTTNLGFYTNRKVLKKVFDYIRSWFIRYHVPFIPINPFLSLYKLDIIHSSKKLLNIIIPENQIIYKPKGTITVVNNNTRSYILLDYVENYYNQKIESILDSMNINIISNDCYIKLFNIKNGMFTNRMYEDMMYSCPRIPYVKLNNIKLMENK